VLTGPKNRQQLQENLGDLREKGPLSEEENGWIREYGQIVHKESSRFTFGFSLSDISKVFEAGDILNRCIVSQVLIAAFGRIYSWPNLTFNLYNFGNNNKWFWKLDF
jgi:hypothetical protein